MTTQQKTQNRSNPFGKREYGHLEKITDRTYIFRNITNSSFVIGDKGVAVIDTQVNHPLAKILLEKIRSVTDKPILYAINTHYHWDHTNGNEVFEKEGAEIVSGAKTKDFMSSRHERQKNFLLGRGFEIAHDPILPKKIFNQEIELDVGGVKLRLFFAGCAESDDATAIHIESENVLMAGDTIMTGSFPIFGQPVWDEGLQGDGLWQKTIQSLMQLSPKHIVPGHGPMATSLDVNNLLEIENWFCESVSSCVNKGLNLDETIRVTLGRMPDWMIAIPQVWGTPKYAVLRVFRGLTKNASDSEPGWQQFKPSAIPDSKHGSSLSIVDQLEEEVIQMADELIEGGDWGQGVKLLRKAAEEYSENLDLSSHLAGKLIEASKLEHSVLEKGDFFNEAKNHWNRVLSVNPNHIPSLMGKGQYLTMLAYRGGEDPEPGMRLLEKASCLSQDNDDKAKIAFYIGMGHRRLGDEVKAKGYFQQALKLNAAFMPATLALNG